VSILCAGSERGKRLCCTQANDVQMWAMLRHDQCSMPAASSSSSCYPLSHSINAIIASMPAACTASQTVLQDFGDGLCNKFLLHTTCSRVALHCRKKHNGCVLHTVCTDYRTQGRGPKTGALTQCALSEARGLRETFTVKDPPGLGVSAGVPLAICLRRSRSRWNHGGSC
jgi:hypothetical protein